MTTDAAVLLRGLAETAETLAAHLTADGADPPSMLVARLMVDADRCRRKLVDALDRLQQQHRQQRRST